MIIFYLEEFGVAKIPANVKYWHGAKKDSWFSYIDIEIPESDNSTEPCEPVTDANIIIYVKI